MCCLYYYVFILLDHFFSSQNEDGTKIEYRVWNPFRQKMTASIPGVVDDVWIESFIHEIAPPAFFWRKTGAPQTFLQQYREKLPWRLDSK